MGKFKAIVYIPAERPNEPRIEQTKTFATEAEATAWAKSRGAEEYAVLPDEDVDQIEEKVEDAPGPLAEMVETKGKPDTWMSPATAVQYCDCRTHFIAEKEKRIALWEHLSPC